MTLLNINQEQRNLRINDPNAAGNKRPLVNFINKAINSSTNSTPQQQQQHHNKLRPISNKCMLRYSYQEPTISTVTQRNNNNADSSNYSTNSLHNPNHRSTNHYYHYHRRPMAMTNAFYFCPNKTNSTSNSFIIEDNHDGSENNNNNNNNGFLSETELNYSRNFNNISINTTSNAANSTFSGSGYLNGHASGNRAKYARNGQSQENDKLRFEANNNNTNNNNRSAFQAIVRTNNGGGGAKNLSTSEGGCLYFKCI